MCVWSNVFAKWTHWCTSKVEIEDGTAERHLQTGKSVLEVTWKRSRSLLPGSGYPTGGGGGGRWGHLEYFKHLCLFTLQHGGRFSSVVLSLSVGMHSFQHNLDTFWKHSGAQREAYCIRSKIPNLLIWVVLLWLCLHFLWFCHEVS